MTALSDQVSIDGFWELPAANSLSYQNELGSSSCTSCCGVEFNDGTVSFRTLHSIVFFHRA